MDYQALIVGQDYAFLRTSPHLGRRICYLTLSGSRAYGTNHAASDVDIRGFALERPEEIFGTQHFEQAEDKATDTVIYSLQKFVHLCSQCNPNVIEMLGTEPEHVLCCNAVGRLIRDHADLFLSKRSYYTFTGYATAQLRRLQNALARDSYPQAAKMEHIRRSLEQIMLTCQEQYHIHEGDITFASEDSGDEEQEKELYTSVHIDHITLRRFLAINTDIGTMLRNYGKLNKRNHKKDLPHLRKHAMHLIRLFLTGLDILEGRGIHTYRREEHDLLLGIRAGDVSFDEVFRLTDEYEQKIRHAFEISKLPDRPDEAAINNLLVSCYKTGTEAGLF